MISDYYKKEHSGKLNGKAAGGRGPADNVLYAELGGRSPAESVRSAV